MSDELRDLLKGLGVTPEQFRSRRVDPPPRPPNTEEIKAYLRGTIDRALREEVRYLIITYEAWHEVHRSLIQDPAFQCSPESERTARNGIFAKLLEYLSWDLDDLIAECRSQHLSPAFRSQRDPLLPFMQELKTLLAPLWKKYRSDRAYQDPTLQAEFITETLQASDLEISIPTDLVAAILVKRSFLQSLEEDL